jgi:hypothetical protein
VRLGQAYHALGCYGPAVEHLTTVIASVPARSIGDYTGTAAPPSVIARVWLTWCLAERGEFPEGLVQAEEALRIADESRQPYPVVAASFGLGLLHLRRGEVRDAVAVLERGMLQ